MILFWLARPIFLGRLGFEDRPYPQEQYLNDLLQAGQSITAKVFVEQGLTGIAIKEAMEQARLNALKTIKHQYDSLDLD